MPLTPTTSTHPGTLWAELNALAGADGTAAHPMPQRLALRGALARDIADAVHALCMLHGRQPGAIDHAAMRNRSPELAGWFGDAVAGFAGERALLARLTSAAGPLPSTPGQAESEAAILAQHHALDTLAQSDRLGCAAGAAIALAIDWHAIRIVLEAAADRFGVKAPPCDMPPDHDGAAIVGVCASQPATARAMRFGAQQLLAQHRALWSLIEARAAARLHA